MLTGVLLCYQAGQLDLSNLLTCMLSFPCTLGVLSDGHCIAIAMSRANHNRSIISSLKWKPLDKLLLLWTLCLIAHRRELQLSCSKAAITRDYGEDIYFTFDTYSDMAYLQKLIDDNMQLTPKGQFACLHWQHISETVYSVV